MNGGLVVPLTTTNGGGGALGDGVGAEDGGGPLVVRDGLLIPLT